MQGRAYPIEQRELLMQFHKQGVSLSILSRISNIPREVLSRWWARYQKQGRAGLEPRSRRPHRFRDQLDAEQEQQILRLRGRGWGPARIAWALQIGHSSVHRVLLRQGRNRLRQPSKPRVFRRYEKSRPGELLHLDLKYLYRWANSSREYAYAVVDDFSREAVACVRPKRSSRDAADFLEEVVSTLPYRIEAVMTDNDLIFSMRFSPHSQRQTYFQQSCRSLGIAHWLTSPHHPQTNGKVERFFRTLDEECLLIRDPSCSDRRAQDVKEFLWYYNYQRPHLSLQGLTPVQRRQAYFQQLQM
jgi:transposase InsO family protein